VVRQSLTLPQCGFSGKNNARHIAKIPGKPYYRQEAAAREEKTYLVTFILLILLLYETPLFDAS
jgi:hypothetical protein